MQRDLRHAQRGQAIVETVIFLPLFLFALFAMIWFVQGAVQSERLQSALRYNALVSQQISQPSYTQPAMSSYTRLSAYAMYQQLSAGEYLGTLPCAPPLLSPLSDAAPSYASSSVATASQPFWQPKAALPSCTAQIDCFRAGLTFAQDVVLSQQHTTIFDFIDVPEFLKTQLGSSSLLQADEQFYGPMSMRIMLVCYAKLNSLLYLNTTPLQDGSSPAARVALTQGFIPTPLSASNSCAPNG